MRLLAKRRAKKVRHAKNKPGPRARPARDGATRAPDQPLNEGASDSYDKVQPPLFRGGSRSSIEAAVVDPDVDDSIGGE